MNVLFCGYRDWALTIYRQIEGMKLITSPEQLNKELQNNNPDIIFFIGWSWIVEPEIVNNNLCICLHPSKLPKYRGGSPIQHQIINGETESSVTLFKMCEGLDKGDIIFQKPFSLEGSLDDIFNRISVIGSIGVWEILNLFPNLEMVPQIETESSYYRRRTPDMSEIKLEDFKNFTSKEIYNKIRSLQDPYPNAYVECQNGTKLFFQRVTYEE
tara:strand:- start:846 stop:1484 length:639 start_codon:yes stop_codon:yes gene_type:complete